MITKEQIARVVQQDTSGEGGWVGALNDRFIIPYTYDRFRTALLSAEVLHDESTIRQRWRLFIGLGVFDMITSKKVHIDVRKWNFTFPSVRIEVPPPLRKREREREREGDFFNTVKGVSE